MDTESRNQPVQWVMLLVRPGCEQTARDGFRSHNVRAYWPNYVPLSRNIEKTKKARDARAVIPGYLFVQMTGKFWDVVEIQKGVSNVIRTLSGEAMFIREQDIEVIRRIEAGLNTPAPSKGLHSFKTGDRVRFKDDSLHSWPVGVISAGLSDGRVSVDIEVMGRVVPFQVFPHQIERAG